MTMPLSNGQNRPRPRIIERPMNNRNHVNKNVDPQIICEGVLSSGENSDYITFRLRILIVDLVCIVTVPEEGKRRAPVYVKFKIDWSQHQPPGSVVIDE